LPSLSTLSVPGTAVGAGAALPPIIDPAATLVAGTTGVSFREPYPNPIRSLFGVEVIVTVLSGYEDTTIVVAGGPAVMIEPVMQRAFLQ